MKEKTKFSLDEIEEMENISEDSINDISTDKPLTNSIVKVYPYRTNIQSIKDINLNKTIYIVNMATTPFHATDQEEKPINSDYKLRNGYFNIFAQKSLENGTIATPNSFDQPAWKTTYSGLSDGIVNFTSTDIDFYTINEPYNLQKYLAGEQIVYYLQEKEAISDFDIEELSKADLEYDAILEPNFKAHELSFANISEKVARDSLIIPTIDQIDLSNSLTEQPFLTKAKVWDHKSGKITYSDGIDTSVFPLSQDTEDAINNNQHFSLTDLLLAIFTAGASSVAKTATDTHLLEVPLTPEETIYRIYLTKEKKTFLYRRDISGAITEIQINNEDVTTPDGVEHKNVHLSYGYLLNSSDQIIPYTVIGKNYIYFSGQTIGASPQYKESTNDIGNIIGFNQQLLLNPERMLTQQNGTIEIYDYDLDTITPYTFTNSEASTEQTNLYLKMHNTMMIHQSTTPGEYILYGVSYQWDIKINADQTITLTNRKAIEEQINIQQRNVSGFKIETNKQALISNSLGVELVDNSTAQATILGTNLFIGTTSASPNKVIFKNNWNDLNMFATKDLASKFKGEKNLESELTGTDWNLDHSTNISTVDERVMVIIKTLITTTLIMQDPSDVPRVQSGSKLVYDPTYWINYGEFAINVASLLDNSDQELKRNDSIFESWRRRNGLTNDSVEVKKAKALIGMLSNYIYSSYSYGQGMSAFNKAICPYYLETKDKISVGINHGTGTDEKKSKLLFINDWYGSATGTGIKFKVNSLWDQQENVVSEVMEIETDRILNIPIIEETVNQREFLNIAGEVKTNADTLKEHVISPFANPGILDSPITTTTTNKEVGLTIPLAAPGERIIGPKNFRRFNHYTYEEDGKTLYYREYQDNTLEKYYENFFTPGSGDTTQYQCWPWNPDFKQDVSKGSMVGSVRTGNPQQARDFFDRGIKIVSNQVLDSKITDEEKKQLIQKVIEYTNEKYNVQTFKIDGITITNNQMSDADLKNWVPTFSYKTAQSSTPIKFDNVHIASSGYEYNWGVMFRKWVWWMIKGYKNTWDFHLTTLHEHEVAMMYNIFMAWNAHNGGGQNFSPSMIDFSGTELSYYKSKIINGFIRYKKKTQFLDVNVEVADPKNTIETFEPTKTIFNKESWTKKIQQFSTNQNENPIVIVNPHQERVREIILRGIFIDNLTIKSNSSQISFDTLSKRENTLTTHRIVVSDIVE